MNIIFEDVCERDIDLLLMNMFSVSEDVFHRFMRELNVADCEKLKIESIEHSYTDDSGESDITVIAKCGEKKLGILVEDKIDAAPQYRQAARYKERGNHGIQEGKYDSFVLTLIAPQEYINADMQDYPYKISYERIIEIVEASTLNNKAFAVALLKRAVTKKATGWTMVPSQNATNFYSDYIACWKKHGFDKIGLIATKDGKEHPQSGNWVEFNTDIKGLRITHKSDRGYVDLCFNGCKGKGAEIQSILREAVDDIENYSIVDTGKSASVRVKREPFNNEHSVAEQEEIVVDCMRVVADLTILSRKLDRAKVEALLASNH